MLTRNKIVTSASRGRQPRHLKVNEGKVKENVRKLGFLSPLAFIQHHARPPP